MVFSCVWVFGERIPKIKQLFLAVKSCVYYTNVREELSLPFLQEPIVWAENGYYLQEGSRPGLHPYHDAGAYYLQKPSAMAPAVLRKEEGEAANHLSFAATKALPTEIAEFFKENRIDKEGRVLFFGETCYLVPSELPELRGLKVLRAGLELGEVRKGRFVPAHALALWLKDFPQKADYCADSAEILSYLKGQTLHGIQKGWTLVTVDGLSLGWAKGSDGVLKNHYPKGLRRL